MNKFFICIIAIVLAVSTICSTVCLPIDGICDLTTTDFAIESEGELEAIDFRLFIDSALENGLLIKSNNLVMVSYLEELSFCNFSEVPNPPPKL
ncbi:MAG TPA: hypothetical protein VJ949_02330 [Cryomorphaceae bacterium]|nr:hypothetical protein [Cryomorphaceae bacterium]